MGSLLVLSAVVIHFIMPGMSRIDPNQMPGRNRIDSNQEIQCLDFSEVPQPPAEGDKPGMCAALQKPGILVALFKVLVSCSSTFEHPYHPLTLLWWEGGWVGGRVFPPMLALFLIREFYSP